jgi:hypothetical protein
VYYHEFMGIMTMQSWIYNGSLGRGMEGMQTQISQLHLSLAQYCCLFSTALLSCDSANQHAYSCSNPYFF